MQLQVKHCGILTKLASWCLQEGAYQQDADNDAYGFWDSHLEVSLCSELVLNALLNGVRYKGTTVGKRTVRS